MQPWSQSSKQFGQETSDILHQVILPIIATSSIKSTIQFHCTNSEALEK